MGKKVLIQNARAIVTCDQNDTVCRNADILVNGPEIESIGPSLRAHCSDGFSEVSAGCFWPGLQ